MSAALYGSAPMAHLTADDDAASAPPSKVMCVIAGLSDVSMGTVVACPKVQYLGGLESRNCVGGFTEATETIEGRSVFSELK